jgi:hypothetical protein
MALVAWSPKGYLAPIELLAAKVPQGKITKRQWIEALADRVTAMAIKAGPEATLQACRDLSLPETDNPQEAGQFLVMANLNLRTNLDCVIVEGKPFPATAKNEPEAQEAIEETDLESWTDLARSLVSESSLD